MSKTKFPEHIQKRLDAGKGCDSWIGTGWVNLVVQLDEQIVQLDPEYSISQIKEKFGGLRYYISISDCVDANDIDTIKKIRTLVYEAEDKSLSICDICGQDGKQLNVNGSGYIATRCEDHKDET